MLDMATRRYPPPIAQISDNLLEVKNLTVDFISASKAPVRAVESVSFVIPRERTVALVGESGSGKSVSALAIMGLLPPQNAIVALHSDGARQEIALLPHAISREFRNPNLSSVRLSSLRRITHKALLLSFHRIRYRQWCPSPP